MAEETKIKISLANLGRKRKNPVSAEGRRNMSLGRMGMKFTDEHRKNMSRALLGRKISAESIKKRSGENHYNWKGTTPINVTIRMSSEYKHWREAVFARDNWTCVLCGIKGAKGIKVILQADHIKPFAHFPELRFSIDNGRTLCVSCHRKTDTYGIKSVWKDGKRINPIIRKEDSLKKLI